ncbi:MAG: type II CAAX prenyl endopeptidase Rce1 family protein, partial [Nitrososphaerales archaeon]
MAEQSKDKLSRTAFLAYTCIFAAACVMIIATMFFSFVLGGYTVFNTELGNREVANPITLVPIFIFGVPLPVFSTATLGDIFSGVWSIYILIFTIAINGPKRSVLGVLRRVRERGRFPFYDNTAFTVVTYFSIMLLVFSIIELIQNQIGIPTGAPPESTPIRAFTMMSLAPIVEEVGFRATLIGGVAFFVLLGRSNRLSSLKAMWHPSRYLEEDPSTRPSEYRALMYFAIVVAGLFFGVAHLAYGTSWEIGKLPTAAIAGILLGWVYFKQGFPAAVLLHWSFN